MKTAEVRETFLRFFEKEGHTRVPSSSLVPAEDPTLLFTNAGMVQFKSVFTGEERRDYSRATSSQRCVRAGGKHNDLEKVGRTARHHTFFEMLGNFSFGDYFKEAAILFARDLLVKTLELDPDRMLYTVFAGEGEIPPDEEARSLWMKIAGVGPERVLSLGASENFWSMGDTGPCGPCSEILYFLGEDIPCVAENSGGRCAGPNCDCDRWIEIWNLVFMQYERRADGSLLPLPKPSIDTGMGLERLTAVLQGVRSNYDIDLFRDLLHALAEERRVQYGVSEETDVSLRVIADHLRASAFLIADGVYPSNIGRGYVLRRIMRRMIRHGRLLGATEPWIHRFVPLVEEAMNQAHPVLAEKSALVTAAIAREEEQFLQRLDRGLELLEREINTHPDRLSGRTVFRLYDTYGFPPDLTYLIAEEKGITVDRGEFEKAMEEQRERSRKASDFSAEEFPDSGIDTPTDYTGYDCLSCEAVLLKSVPWKGRIALFLDRTPFYAEAGGQIGDRGWIRSLERDRFSFRVEDTQKTPAGVYYHIGVLEKGSTESLVSGTTVICEVDSERRIATERNHTATHLLHAALRSVLGDHVQQSGSYVGPDRLRFDFSHFQGLTREELAEVERRANENVLRDLPVQTRVLPIEEARSLGAMAFFGEKYGELVRVVCVEGIPRYGEAEGSLTASREFCGGTHVKHSGEIGPIRIVSETAIASGVRRIEALTGREAVNAIVRDEGILSVLCRELSASTERLPERFEAILSEKKHLEKSLAELRITNALLRLEQVQPEEINHLSVLTAFEENLSPSELRDLALRLEKKHRAEVVVLGSAPPDGRNGRKAAFCVAVTKEAAGKIAAGKIAAALAQMCGGRGGGKPTLAQAGGKDGGKVRDALRRVPEIIRA
ncbi:MAG: alanine--tRNA ligase [Candidatus Hydrogenedentota bacterium]|nr:MAG: alanine--tRNA ligase [Candidatus Hydrogenedentota bacterium]